MRVWNHTVLLSVGTAVLVACGDTELLQAPEEQLAGVVGCAATFTRTQANPLHGSQGFATWELRNTGTKTITGLSSVAGKKPIVNSATDNTTYPFTLAVGASRLINVRYTTSGTGTGFVSVTVTTSCANYGNNYNVSVP